MKIIIIADGQSKSVELNPSHFEKTVTKVVERKKDFQLPGISFTPNQAQVLAVIAKNIMPESEFTKFEIRLKNRIGKPFQPTYCGPEATIES